MTALERAAILANMGIPIIESPHVYVSVIKKRTWRERLFSWPWKPRMKTRVVKEPAMFIVNNPGLHQHIVAHPALAAKLRGMLT